MPVHHTRCIMLEIDGGPFGSLPPLASFTAAPRPLLRPCSIIFGHTGMHVLLHLPPCLFESASRVLHLQASELMAMLRIVCSRSKTGWPVAFLFACPRSRIFVPTPDPNALCGERVTA